MARVTGEPNTSPPTPPAPATPARTFYDEVGGAETFRRLTAVFYREVARDEVPLVRDPAVLPLLDALRAAQPELMRGVTKGVVHKNTASRKMSRLAARVKALSAA